VASVPTEHLGGSGLVAAVAAGLVTGRSAPRYLSARHRLAEASNWRTVELLAEGAIFLLMGLELHGLLDEVDPGQAWTAVGLGALTAVLVVAVRAVYVTPLLLGLRRHTRRAQANREKLTGWQDELDAGTMTMPRRPGRRSTQDGPDRVRSDASSEGRGRRGRDRVRSDASSEGRGRRGRDRVPVPANRLAQVRTRVTRSLADIDYLAGSPMGWREGTLLVWAGMRGAVTVAAAQTLPEDTPQRSLLVLIAFVVAAGTLLVQGATLPALVRALRLPTPPPEVAEQERGRLLTELAAAAQAVVEDPDLRRSDGRPYDPEMLERARFHPPALDDEAMAAQRDVIGQSGELRQTVMTAMRDALLRARDDGTYDSAVLESALRALDADQLSLETRRGPTADGTG
jgi:CPA1 family monovalent cation:H+ antiporter